MKLCLRALLVAILAVVTAPSLLAGTQDFVLVNHTGVEIYRLYISETTTDEWEEDVLGDNTLPDGERMDITFEGRSACMWDVRVEDEEGSAQEWNSLNLCEVSVVVLRCNSEECWADLE